MKKNKPGQGRKHIDPALRRSRITVWLDPNFKKRFKIWCKRNKIAQSKAIEKYCSEGTDDFTKDIE